MNFKRGEHGSSARKISPKQLSGHTKKTGQPAPSLFLCMG
jgi:hypothetical protein